jgi:hypothetical protein
MSFGQVSINNPVRDYRSVEKNDCHHHPTVRRNVTTHCIGLHSYGMQGLCVVIFSTERIIPDGMKSETLQGDKQFTELKINTSFQHQKK